MKRKILVFVLTLCMLSSSVPCIYAAEIVDSGTCGSYKENNGQNVTWKLDTDGTLTISGEGEIGDQYLVQYNPWYQYRDTIKNVYIDKNITRIGANAFYGCEIEAITIPEKVTSIGTGAFQFCSALTEVTISGTVQIIDEYAFNGCSNLKNFTIPNSVTSIGNGAFECCTNLTSITIPPNITNIGDMAFWKCTNLTNIKIPDGINLGRDVFEKTAYYNNPENWENGVLYMDNYLIKAKEDYIFANYKIREDIKVIAGSAFEGIQNISSVIVPEGVIIIGDAAFQECTNLTNVTLPNSINNIGEHSFSTSGLTDIKLPEGLTQIHASTFYACKSLKSITIPQSISKIYPAAFFYCDNLTDVYYNGDETMWGNILIYEYNDELIDADIHYTSNIPNTTPIPITTAEITRTDAEADTAYTFEVDAADKYENCYVYTAIYDKSGALLRVSRTRLEKSNKTIVSINKSQNDKMVKVFIWADTLQPIIVAEEIPLI